MDNDNRHISWFGIALVVIGVALLVDRLHILQIEFPMVLLPLLMLLGIVIVGRGFSGNRGGKIFWGTVLFLYALYFLLRSLDFLEPRNYMFFSVGLLVFGCAFLMLFVNNFREWYYLIPAFILCGMGSMFVFTELGYLDAWDVWEVARLYWPAALILIGVALIMRHRARRAASHETPMDNLPPGAPATPVEPGR